VVKHAHASHVWITVVAAQQGTVVTVDDDGIGFEPSSVPGGHLGVTGMRARAGLIGGTFEIGRRDRGGTRVRVRVRAPDGDRSQVADAAVAP
jgi:signal transduction histidine kinase